MAALTATTATRLGAATSGGAVAASDTIAASVLGQSGAFLEIINGNAATDNMTISDAGSTPAGSPLSAGNYAVSVTNGTSKIFKISRKQLDPTSKVVTVSHSVITTVTYKLYPAG